jgi:hypothetical protein
MSPALMRGALLGCRLASNVGQVVLLMDVMIESVYKDVKVSRAVIQPHLLNISAVLLALLTVKARQITTEVKWFSI